MLATTASSTPAFHHAATATMGTSTARADATKASLDDTAAKEATPLPDAYKTFLDSISHKITRYLDQGDDAAAAARNDAPPPAPAPPRPCATCGGVRRPSNPQHSDGRHDQPADGGRRRCQCR